jgi:hypothetical protein
MIIVPEGSTAWLDVVFKNKTGNNETPSFAEYRIDTTDRSEIRTWTEVPALSDSVELTLTPSDNTMADQNAKEQTNVVTVRAVFGSDGEHIDTYSYKVSNVHQIPKQ